MACTVSELKELLEQMEEDGYGDIELRFVYQQNYPLQDTVCGVAIASEDEDDEDKDVTKESDPKYIYIVSGGQDHDEPYGPKSAFDNVL